MPSVAHIEAADPLSVDQATNLMALLISSERFKSESFRFTDLSDRLTAKINLRKPLTDATNTAPIVITSTAHGFADGALVRIQGVLGNTAANNAWVVANKTDDTFELFGSVGTGAYTSGGEVLDVVSQQLSAIAIRIELDVGEGTVAIKGAKDGTVYSQDSHRDWLLGQVFGLLYTEAELSSGNVFVTQTMRVPIVPVW